MHIHFVVRGNDARLRCCYSAGLLPVHRFFLNRALREDGSTTKAEPVDEDYWLNPPGANGLEEKRTSTAGQTGQNVRVFDKSGTQTRCLDLDVGGAELTGL